MTIVFSHFCSENLHYRIMNPCSLLLSLLSYISISHYKDSINHKLILYSSPFSDHSGGIRVQINVRM